MINESISSHYTLNCFQFICLFDCSAFIYLEDNGSASQQRPIQQEPIDDTMRSSLRPTTARPGAPRPKLINEPEEAAHSKIHTCSKAKSTLIVNSDSDDDFVVKEQKVQEDERRQQKYDEVGMGMGMGGGEVRGGEEGADGQGGHGALVKKILESKEQLEYGSELKRNQEFVSFGFIHTPLCKLYGNVHV